MEETIDILLTGDFIIDHHLLKGNKSEASVTGSIGTRSDITHMGVQSSHFDLANHFLNRIISDPENKSHDQNLYGISMTCRKTSYLKVPVMIPTSAGKYQNARTRNRVMTDTYAD